MYFGQKIHPLNFDHPEQVTLSGEKVLLTGKGVAITLSCAEILPGCVRWRCENAAVSDIQQLSDAVVPAFRTGHTIIPTQEKEQVRFITHAGTLTLSGAQCWAEIAGFTLATVEQGIGACGENLQFSFHLNGIVGAYGLGERTKRLNKLGDSADNWTVDVVAVFRHTYDRDDYDPTYVAIPFVVLRNAEGRHIGLFFDNAGRSIIDVGKHWPDQCHYQSLGGITDVYFLAGPTLADVTRRFSNLIGRAPLPPLWALGYHQCRWSYFSEKEFRALARQFADHDIPISALWYDIDYMDGYRLFTWDQAHFPDPPILNRDLKARGIRTVTIIDPGVKREPGYMTYDSGHAQQVFCQTASGREYVGKVWPGDTVFPDFTLEKTRKWWAKQLTAFMKASGIDGVWLDMNDPATGYSRTEEMRFDHGTIPHDRYHNQYAHYMAMASYAACEKMDPEGRPFLLTRSASAGTQRYSAVWTGDNASNWKHLRMSLPCSLNLSLSGISFNGPDVGGFMDDTNAELLVRWHQAGCLFPFFRNHSMKHSRFQEPWQFGPEATAAIRGTIHTRYRLMPYLYQCFFQHWKQGDPILRPIAYHYPSAEYADVGDQYMVGDALLVAPILHGQGEAPESVRAGVKRQERMVQLPPGHWFDLNRGQWTVGGRIIRYEAALDELPLFVRDGALVPFYAGPLRNGSMDLRQVELHVFSYEKPAQSVYYLDDQRTMRYQKGDDAVAHIQVDMREAECTVAIDMPDPCPHTVQFFPVFYGKSSLLSCTMAINGHNTLYHLRAAQRAWLCRTHPVLEVSHG